MENNGLLKLIVLLIAGLCIWNTYRIETSLQGRNEPSEYRDTVFVSCPDGVAPADNRIDELVRTVNTLKKKVESQQSTIDRLSRQQKQPQSTTSRQTARPASQASPKVDAKVRVDNRYVSGTTYLPKTESSITGTVVIKVTMDRVGIVSNVSIGSGTTIENEDIIHNCKEAALKTHFAYNPEAPDTSTGTITYIFSN